MSIFKFFFSFNNLSAYDFSLFRIFRHFQMRVCYLAEATQIKKKLCEVKAGNEILVSYCMMRGLYKTNKNMIN